MGLKEMGRKIKNVLHRHEDLSQIPGTQGGMVVCIYNLSAGETEGETVYPWGLPATQANQVSELQIH